MLTPAQRAELTAQLRRDRIKAATDHIPRRDPALARIPASFGQEQLWFIDRYAPGQATYNIPCAIRIGGSLDVPALRRALDELIARHESLRTRLVSSDGPEQVIDVPGPCTLETTELGDADLARILHAEAMRPFDLATGPLLRTRLLRLDHDEHLLVAVFHHTIFDGWSAGVFLHDLAALYASEVTGQPARLAEMPVQFADYAVWERDRLRGEPLEKLESYWRKTLADVETVQFPTDRPRPAVDDFAGGLCARTCDIELLAGLRELARAEGATVFTTVLAALLALLQRYTGQTDLVVGTVSANRGRAELAPLIGFLVNTLPIRADLSGDPAFAELLGRVKEATVSAFAHQDLPFGKLVETLGVPRDASRAPLFQIALTYAERATAPVSAAGVELLHTDLIAGLPAAKFDLTFAAEARGGGLWIECSYKTALFDAGTIERLLGHLETLLAGVVAKPDARLSELPVLSEAELEAEIRTWNDTAGPVPDGCAHDRFEAQAAATPHAVAARFGDQEVSYAQLDRQASQVARYLRAQGVGPESLVGVCMRTSLRRLAAFIGIWKAGGGYVPLDPDLPAERLAFMISDTGMRVLVTDNDAAGSLPDAGNVKTIMLNWPASSQEWAQQPIQHDHAAEAEGAADTAERAGPGNVAYVLYTSGSTGQPKGVVIEHRSLVNLTHAMSTRWQIGPGSTVLQFASFTFDVSVMDMFTPLLSGATVILADRDTLLTPHRLAQLIRDQHITFAGLPPAVLNLLPHGHYPHLRHIMAAGEELPADLARRWTQPGSPQLINGYGPTETTIIATQAEIDASTPMPPPIGHPVHPNYRAYVLDPHLNPVPAGVTGELHIGGTGVARGYLNRTELTRQRFIPDPFTPGERLYKTGDLVKRRTDGSIVYQGRIDNQVKINGIRIELGEIETALLTHPAINQALALVTDGELTAYIHPLTPTTDTSIRDHLARTLPATMIPTHLITLNTFPLNPSGKIDRSALPAPVPAAVTDHVPPGTLLEVLLADIYAGLLGIERVGATDGFFDLGGTSIRAMGLVSALDEELNVDVAVAAIFLAPTPRQLAALLRTEHGLDDEGLDG